MTSNFHLQSAHSFSQPDQASSISKIQNRFSGLDISILIGNTLDHFDTALYGFLAPLFGKIFFPNHEPVVQIILAYSVFTTSLITRPLGSVLFGILARKRGPTLGLSYSLMGMCLPAIIFGFLPGFSEIGAFAPLGLVLIRMLRGIFAAGERTIGALYILEGKTETLAKKCAYAYQTSSMLGMVLASMAATFILAENNQDLPLFWRCLFSFGGIIGLVGFFLRYYASSSQSSNPNPSHNATAPEAKTPTFNAYRISSLKAIWTEKLNIIRVALGVTFSHVTYAVPFVFMNSFVPFITNISQESMLALNTVLLILDMMMLPILGKLTLKYKIKKVMLFACFTLLCTVIPLFVFLPQSSLMYVTFVRTWIVFLGVIFLCPLSVWFKSLFHNQPDQYLLSGMGHALGAAFGRMIPAICLGIWHATGALLAPAYFIIFMTVLMICALKNG